MRDALSTLSEIVLLEALVLGVFSTGGLIFALLLLTGKLQWAREEFRALCKVSPQVLIFGGFLTLFPVYFLGVITHQVADTWIDKPSGWYHLGLKSLWNDYDDDKTDDSIKCEMYRRIFDCGEGFCNNCKTEEKMKTQAYEWYHDIYSHQVRKKGHKYDSFRKSVQHSQKQVNLMRLGNFVSLFVFAVCLVRLLFLFVRAGWHRLRPKFSVSLRKSDLFLVLIVAVASGLIYFASGKVWAKAERGTSLKVWRFAKLYPKELPESIPKLNECPQATVFVKGKTSN